MRCAGVVAVGLPPTTSTVDVLEGRKENSKRDGEEER